MYTLSLHLELVVDRSIGILIVEHGKLTFFFNLNLKTRFVTQRFTCTDYAKNVDHLIQPEINKKKTTLT